MKLMILGICMAVCTLGSAGFVAAQSNGSAASPGFNLDQLLGFDLENMMQGLAFELESSKGIWGEYVDPAFIDSTMGKMNDMDFGNAFGELFDAIQNHLNEEDGVGSMLGQLLQNFQMPMNGLPLQQMPFQQLPGMAPPLPQAPQNGGWEIIPNIPRGN